MVFDRFNGWSELALFAGAGGGILGGRMLGWRTVCAVEIERYPREILLQRQRDGILDPFPIWDDVCTFDGNPWRGKVDVISGGFPCQDISAAGKGAGIADGTRSGLWREYARIIREVRPAFVFVENSAMLNIRGLGRVLGDLAEAGYDAAWKVLSAEECGAPHLRERMWIVARNTERRDIIPYAELHGIGRRELLAQSIAEANGTYTDSVRGGFSLSADEPRLTRLWEDNAVIGTRATRLCPQIPYPTDERNVRCLGRVGADGQNDTSGDDDRIRTAADWGRQWWSTEPELGRVADGVANRVDRIKAIGNGQVPLVAARAFSELYDELMKGDN